MTFKTLLYIRKNFKRQIIDKNLELDRVLRAMDRIKDEEGTCWEEKFNDAGNRTEYHALKMEREQLTKELKQIEDAVIEIENSVLK